MASAKRFTFRIQHIPADMDGSSLRDAIRGAARGDDADELDLRGELVSSCYSGDQSSTAIVQFFPSTPMVLEGIERDRTAQTEVQLSLGNGTIMSVDRHFYGLTPLYQPASAGEITMDIVAVAGLDGNAFGSWMSKESGAMWLRDFLKEDLPRCRVLTYGYNAKLAVDKNYSFEDFCSQFLDVLKTARNSDHERRRPLILIGHSYGARLITKTLVRCKINDAEPTNAAVLDSVQAVVFFGAPHHGLLSDMQDYLGERFPPSHNRQRIIHELRRDNEATERELKDFIDLLPRFFIISIYEQSPTKSLQSTEPRDATNGTNAPKVWKREGPPYVPVERSSALLNLPLSLEVPIPSEKDHSNMAKFSHKDQTYRVLVGYLQETEASIGKEAFPYTQLLYAGARRLRSIRDLSGDGAVLRERAALVQPGSRRWFVESRHASGSTSVGAAISHCENLQSLASQPQDHDVLQETLVALRTAQCLLAVASGSPTSTDSAPSRCQDVLLVVARYNAASSSITRLLEPFDGGEPISLSGNVVRSLKANITDLENLNGQLRRSLDLDAASSFPGLKSRFANPRPNINTMARMSTAFNRLDQHPMSGVLWVPSSALKFALGDVQEGDRAGKGWLQWIVESFTGEAAASMKLKRRRYGVLDHDGHLEKVMVEFRPYPELDEGDEDGAADYEIRRWAVAQLARTLTCSMPPDTESSFPSVPLRCLSEIGGSSTPCFLLVYAADGLYGLDEVISRHAAPPSDCRLWLALCYARALASLHLADLVHGSINTENLYVRAAPLPPGDSFSSSSTSTPVFSAGDIDLAACTPLMAGFELARPLAGRSDKLDTEEPHLRVYQHPDRLNPGDNKSHQHPRYDVFGLGMAMVEIGLWKRFQSCRGYPPVSMSDSDHTRQAFCRSLRRKFRGSMSEGNMGDLYGSIISFCLEKGPDPLPDKVRAHRPSHESWVFWKSSRVVELLQILLDRVALGATGAVEH